MNLGGWCHCTRCVRRVRRLHPQRRPSFAYSLVYVTRISCHGHYGNGGIMRLLFNERHLAATNCLLVPWHTDPQRLACMHCWKVCHGHLLKLIMLSNPTASATLLGQMTGGVLCQYIKRSRWILITWCTMLTIFSASMVSIQPGQQSKGIGLMFMACYSVGVIETCSLSLAPLSCATEDIGAALGALGSIRSGGASVATAISLTI